MPCFYPIEAYRTEDGAIVFAERGRIASVLQLPCGRCVGCRLEYSRVWAVRIMHEARMHERSSFLTLTYDDEHLPYRGMLVYRHFQLFMKRLRQEVRSPLRFYACGEYGEKTWRPHFHVCLFGHAFDSDRVPTAGLFADYRSDYTLYKSESLTKLWNKGFCSIGELEWKSAGYVARYVLKKVNGKAAEQHYERVDDVTGEIYYLPPEFAHMSLKPGIGATWFARYKSEVSVHNRVVMNGIKMAPPKYYRDLLRESNPDEAEYVDYLNSQCSGDPADRTYERMRVRETVTKARLSFKQRSLK